MRFTALLILIALFATSAAAARTVDERPAGPGEWGFRPSPGSRSLLDPPAFSWRPQKGAKAYELEVSGAKGSVRYSDITYNVFCPSIALGPGEFSWKFRFCDSSGQFSLWSRPLEFSIGEGRKEFPLPDRASLLARIPKGHPRLFMRPEMLEAVREMARGARKGEFDLILKACEKLLKSPPDSAEPPKYPRDMKRKSEEWKKMWWGNRVYTIRLLESAATLAFAGLVAGRDDFRVLARRLLLDAARWDPHGSTGFVYNDEAGMPYAYHFCRTYTFLHEFLDEGERDLCREVMTRRGREMFRQLCPRHLWWPYSSHSNRAWHFLGEVGVAFFGEIDDAADWVWFAANVFRCVYPVWSDDDGGWHEGVSYWRSYIGRFTWWAAVMKEALGLDAYDLPYFSEVGYYPMYLQPPGHKDGGFGDLCGGKDSRGNVPLMEIFASQSRNPHWRWYSEVQGGFDGMKGDYIWFLRDSREPAAVRPPSDLPSSRLFAGTGQAALNSNLLDGKENVQVIFKSSPLGSQSHGYESQNAFIFSAFGEPLFIRTGRRDIYGSEHHTRWMWETKSVNSVTAGGAGQISHRSSSVGAVTEFSTSPAVDFVAGECGGAYGGKLDSFKRRILFVKPDLVVLFDTLSAPAPEIFEWWLHSPGQMEIEGQTDIRTAGSGAAARASLLVPEGLDLELTDRFDPPPRPNVKLTQWHLKASTPKKAKTAVFVASIRAHRPADPAPTAPTVTSLPGGFALDAAFSGGKAVILLRTGPGGLTHRGFTTESRVGVKLTFADGRAKKVFECRETTEEDF